MEIRVKVTASVDTPHGKHYLRKLCMHFARKAPATFSDTRGRIDFPFGTCRILVQPRHMRLVVEVGSVKQADEAEKTLQEPVLKIASRGQPTVIWHREWLGQSQRAT